jgi:hypothetical protein
MSPFLVREHARLGREEFLRRYIFNDHDEYKRVDDEGISYIAKGVQEMERVEEEFKDFAIGRACLFADVVREVTGEQPSQTALESFIAKTILES